MLAEGSDLNPCFGLSCDDTLVLPANRDQGFHWWRGTALSHSSSAKRGTRKGMKNSDLPHSTKPLKHQDAT